MWELLALGTIWFWIITAIAVFLIISFIENFEENGSLSSTATIIVYGVLLYFFGAKEFVLNIFEFVKNSPFQTIGIIILYLLIGLIYSFLKWYSFLKMNKANGYTKPLASRNKGRITAWITYWPLSLAWTFLNDPVKKLVSWIYDKFQSVYVKIEESVYKPEKKEDAR